MTNEIKAGSKILAELLPTGSEIDEAADKYGFRVPYDGLNNFYDADAIKHFLAGVRFVEEHATEKANSLKPKEEK